MAELKFGVKTVKVGFFARDGICEIIFGIICVVFVEKLVLTDREVPDEGVDDVLNIVVGAYCFGWGVKLFGIGQF